MNRIGEPDLDLPDAFCDHCGYRWNATELPQPCWCCGLPLRSAADADYCGVRGGQRVAGAAIILFVCVLLGALVAGLAMVGL